MTGLSGRFKRISSCTRYRACSCARTAARTAPQRSASTVNMLLSSQQALVASESINSVTHTTTNTSFHTQPISGVQSNHRASHLHSTCVWQCWLEWATVSSQARYGMVRHARGLSQHRLFGCQVRCLVRLLCRRPLASSSWKPRGRRHGGAHTRPRYCFWGGPLSEMVPNNRLARPEVVRYPVTCVAVT